MYHIELLGGPMDGEMLLLDDLYKEIRVAYTNERFETENKTGIAIYTGPHKTAKKIQYKFDHEEHREVIHRLP